MKTSDFGYDLPAELIAQEPWPVRDACKLLVLDKQTGAVADKHFFNVADYFEEGDLLVVNETRVLPARLLGKKRGTGGECEILLLKQLDKKEYEHSEHISDSESQYWEALTKPGKRLKPVINEDNGHKTYNGPIVDFYHPEQMFAEDNCNLDSSKAPLSAQIIDWGAADQPGLRIVRLFSDTCKSVDEALHKIGKTPLPPYIKDYSGNMEMYQTVYSKNESSAAAPTAGLHFTDELIDYLQNKGVGFKTVELEVGIDTFRPVDEEDPRDHKMHTELYTISQDTIEAIEKTKEAGHKVIAVGTTSVRTLESAWNKQKNQLEPCTRKPTSLFILPGYKFSVVDSMITNFHIPESTLMMLVSAFAGYNNIMSAYKHAVEQCYRFLSFGDAMLVI